MQSPIAVFLYLSSGYGKLEILKENELKREKNSLLCSICIFVNLYLLMFLQGNNWCSIMVLKLITS